jgi:bisphosphoglycerate-independent phosphoglycerate mutase (AlkP superfamily)
VDKCLAELLAACDAMNGRWLVTSDHGNADDMVQRTKKGEPIFEEGKAIPLTSHTLAPVGIAVGGSGLPASIKVRNACSVVELECRLHGADAAQAPCRPATAVCHADQL